MQLDLVFKLFSYLFDLIQSSAKTNILFRHIVIIKCKKLKIRLQNYMRLKRF